MTSFKEIVQLKLPFLMILICQVTTSMAQNMSLTNMLNHPVGGIWVSNNKDNSGQEDDFKTFFMSFSNGINIESVWGEIQGVKNNGDTIRLIEIWTFVNPSESNITLIQKTAWGEICHGTIEPYQHKHLDIQFKSVTPDGIEYYTRDIHYLEGQDIMTAFTYQKSNESDDWKEQGTSKWKRLNGKQVQTN